METTMKSFNYLFVKKKDYFVKVKFSEIKWVEAYGSYSKIYLENGHFLTLSFNLSEIANKLTHPVFIRVHRSYLINIDYVDAFIGNMICIGEVRLPISKQHRKEVLLRFNILK